VHVGFNLIYLVPGETGGRETYARELAPRLAERGVRLTCFVNREAFDDPGSPWRELGTVVRVPVSGRSRPQWAVGEQLLLPGLAARARIDLLHSPANFTPAWGPFARVVTLHDLLFLRHPEFMTAAMRLGTRSLVPLGASRSDRVITGSEAARAELQSFLRLAPGKVDVVPHGVAPPAVAATPAPALRERLGLGERPFVLTVASRLPHKNLAAVADAAASLASGERPLFVLAGAALVDDELERRAQRLGVEGDLRKLGFVDQADLEGLYAAAGCLLQPSLYEGFGLPVLEAMVRGLPVACSDIPPFREVAGEAAVLFDPHDPASMGHAVRRAAGNEELAAAGRRRAEQFTWARASEGTLAAYRRALDSQRQ
jgi:glycosyltransferase involved in cell wall biosynthesis